MKTRIAKGLDGEKYAMFWCPGCDEPHGPIVQRERPERPLWGWNADRERPTFTPSILVTGKRKLTEDEYQRILRGEQIEIPDKRCHTFVTDGRIQFLGDCTHALAGQTVEIPDWPWPDEKDAE